MQSVADTITSGGELPGCGARASVGGTPVNGYWEWIERISGMESGDGEDFARNYDWREIYYGQQAY